jgi:Glucodextranase, domain B
MTIRAMMFLLLLPPIAGPGQEKDPFILVVVPEADTTSTMSSVYRLSASTNPGRTVTVNGTAYDVFPSGAFAGLLNLDIGENIFRVRSTDTQGSDTNRYPAYRLSDDAAGRRHVAQHRRHA